MKITLENTPQIVELNIRGNAVPARIWQGETAGGIPVQAWITRIAPEVPTSDPAIEEKTAQFEHELRRMADPRPSVEGIPLRFFID